MDKRIESANVRNLRQGRMFGLLVLLLPLLLAAQPSWQRFGMSGMQEQTVAPMRDSSGRRWIAGTGTDSAGGSAALLMRLDAEGIPDRTLLLQDSALVYVEDALALPGGGFLLCGARREAGAAQAAGLLWCVDSSGHTCWRVQAGASLRRALLLPDGCVVACGHARTPAGRNAALALAASAGSIRWQTQTADSLGRIAQDLCRMPGGQIALAGDVVLAPGLVNPFVWKLDSAGHPQALHTLASPYNSGAQDLLLLRNGDLLLTGEGYPPGEWYFDVLFIRLQPDGSERFRCTWGEDRAEAGFHTLELPDGRWLTCGYGYESGSGTIDGLILLSDSSGQVLDFQHLGDSGGEYFYKWLPDSAGAYLAAGFSVTGTDIQALLGRYSLPAPAAREDMQMAVHPFPNPLPAGMTLHVPALPAGSRWQWSSPEGRQLAAGQTPDGSGAAVPVPAAAGLYRLSVTAPGGRRGSAWIQVLPR
ncbi:MAG: hypothetical protein NW241_02995 [Bacteroidia bacterium]|nr:hypothetical protein [Bacteroidia bacterium]